MSNSGIHLGFLSRLQRAALVVAIRKGLAAVTKHFLHLGIHCWFVHLFQYLDRFQERFLVAVVAAVVVAKSQKWTDH
jgi:hypothetical protein